MTVQVYTQNESIPVANGCFAFMFTNVGNTPAEINGMVVFPSSTPTTALGDSRTISGHQNDLYKGNITLKFNSPVGSSTAVEVVQLYYIVN